MHEMTSYFSQASRKRLHETRSDSVNGLHETQSEYTAYLHEMTSYFFRTGRDRLHEITSEYQSAAGGVHSLEYAMCCGREMQ